MKMKKIFFTLLITMSILNAHMLVTKDGWSLAGSSVEIEDLNTTFSKADILWKWNKRDKQWMFYAPLNDNLNKIAQNLGYEIIKKINCCDGFWIKGEAAEYNLSGTYDNKDIELIKGWNLISFSGEGIEDSNSTLSKISDLKMAWKYINGRWKGWRDSFETINKLLMAGYEKINYIKEGEGIWIFVDSNTTIDNKITPWNYRDYKISDGGWIINGGIDESGNFGKILIGERELFWVEKNIWRVLYENNLSNNAIITVPSTAIIDNGDGIFNKAEDIKQIGFVMKAPFDCGVISPLTTLLAEKPEIFPENIKNKVKNFDPSEALLEFDDSEIKNLFILNRIAGIYNNLKYHNMGITFEDFNFSYLLNNLNQMDDSKILNAIKETNSTNLGEIIKNELNSTISATNLLFEFSNLLKQNMDNEHYVAFIKALYPQIFDYENNLSIALENLENVEDINISNIKENLKNIINNSDIGIENMFKYYTLLFNPMFSLGNFNFSDINFSNITEALENANFVLDKYEFLENFKNIGFGFDLKNLSHNITFTTNIKYKIEIANEWYVSLEVRNVPFIVKKGGIIEINNTSSLPIEENDGFSATIKMNLDGTEIEENVTIDETLFYIENQKKVNLDLINLFEKISSKIDNNINLKMAIKLIESENKVIKFAVGLSNPPEEISDKFLDASLELGEGYKGYVVQIDNEYVDGIYKNILSLRNSAESLPINIQEYNISEDFNISQDLGNIDINFLSKISTEFNTTMITKVKIVIDDNKYVMLESDPLDIKANPTEGVTIQEIGNKYITFNSNIEIPVVVLGIPLTVPIPETKIPIEKYLKQKDKGIYLDIQEFLELLSSQEGADDSESQMYKKIVEKVNQEIQNASKVELLIGFKFENTSPAIVQTLFDTILKDSFEDPEFSGFKGIKTRIK